MSLRPRLVYALVFGLVGAGIVHIASLFALPQYAVRQTWSRLSELTAPYQTLHIDPRRIAMRGLTPQNPYLEASGCRFDLADGPMRVSAPSSLPYWSISVYDQTGAGIFSMSDRAANKRTLDLVILTPVDMMQVRRQDQNLVDGPIHVEIDDGKGFLIARALMLDQTWRSSIEDFLDGLDCQRME